MFNFEDRIDLIFKTGFLNFQFNFGRALALVASRASAPSATAAADGGGGIRRALSDALVCRDESSWARRSANCVCIRAVFS